METLVLKNFLVIKDASLDVKKFNIIIGSQGTGKSVLAKTVYFFKSCESSLRKNISKIETFEQFSESFIERFTSLFPSYAWEHQDFSITYHSDNLLIRISNDAGKLLVSFDPKIVTAYKKCLDKMSILLEEMDENKSSKEMKYSLPVEFLYKEQIRNWLKNSDLKIFIEDANFIPASRSFFSQFQENLFTILSSRNNLDPLLVDFGRLYEVYLSFFLRNKNDLAEILPTQFIKDILGGEISKIDDKIFLVNNNSKTEVIHTSSGQQEALPMLITLAVLSYIQDESYIFIEEPEAHLFPISQAKIIKLLTNMYSNSFNFFITTHSPYILSELNNYLYAKDLMKRGLLSQEEYDHILPSTSAIDINDICAYKIEDGFLYSIINEEYSMIDSEELDKASSHASDIYNQLLEFEPQD